MELHPDPVEDVAAVAAALPPTGDDLVPQGPPTRLRWLIDRAFGSFPRRRLQLNLTSQESTLETATAIDRDSTKAISPPGPGLAAAVPLSTLTAIERAATATNDAVKPTSKPQADLAAPAHLSTGTATERATTLTRDDVKPASKRRADLAAAAHLSTGVATERATTGTKDSVKQATERATAGTNDSVKPASAPDLAPAARLSTETAFESPTAFGSPNAASPREPDLAAAAHLCTELGRVIEPRRCTAAAGRGREDSQCDRLDRVGVDSHGTALGPRLRTDTPRTCSRNCPESGETPTMRRRRRFIGGNANRQWQRFRERRRRRSLDDPGRLWGRYSRSS